MQLVNGPRATSILFDVLSNQANQPGTVLLPANICPIVPLSVARAGRQFEFIDICPKTLAMDTHAALDRLRRAPDVGAMIYVHTYGAVLDVDDFVGQIRRLNPETLVIDDRCAARPAQLPLLWSASEPDVILFSTGYGKYVDLGWGGYAALGDRVTVSQTPRPFDPGKLALLTTSYQALVKEHSDSQRASLLRLARDSDWLELTQPEKDANTHIKEVEKRLPAMDDHKATINHIYSSELPETVQLERRFNDWRFQLVVPDKGRCLAALFAEGLFASDHYFPASRLLQGQICPRAEEHYKHAINLFNDFNITQTQARAVAACLRRVLKST